jgi:type II secretion system protein G
MKRGFTLIELLVVIAIIGLLSSVVLASLNTARSKARDAERRQDLEQVSTALELRYSDTDSYPSSAGWFNNPNHGGLDAALTTTYIPSIPDDPTLGSTAIDYVLARGLCVYRLLRGRHGQRC